MKKLMFSKTFIWASIFAVAMAFIESSVVVYLRELYYPEGFVFPLKPIDSVIAFTEFLREAATIIMLVSLAFLAGKNFSQGFAYFLYGFAIWDIFYYVFLYALLGWPESLMTWDILFLIPVSWISPVICPIILSFSMIGLACIILYYESRGILVKIKRMEWLLLITGSLAAVLSFTLDSFQYFLGQYSPGEIIHMLRHDGFDQMVFQFIPKKFKWWIFWLGEAIILFGIIRIFYIQHTKITSQ